MFFGMERSLAGLPLHIKKECPADKEFLSHMENVHFLMSDGLNEFHEKSNKPSIKGAL